jgi:hypothetical protein
MVANGYKIKRPMINCCTWRLFLENRCVSASSETVELFIQEKHVIGAPFGKSFQSVWEEVGRPTLS